MPSAARACTPRPLPRAGWMAHAFADHPETAAAFANRALRLSPFDTSAFEAHMALGLVAVRANRAARILLYLRDGFTSGNATPEDVRLINLIWLGLRRSRRPLHGSLIHRSGLESTLETGRSSTQARRALRAATAGRRPRSSCRVWTKARSPARSAAAIRVRLMMSRWAWLPPMRKVSKRTGTIASITRPQSPAA